MASLSFCSPRRVDGGKWYPYHLFFGPFRSLTTESRVYWDIAIEGQKEDAPTHQLADVSLEDFTNGSQAIATSLTKVLD